MGAEIVIAEHPSLTLSDRLVRRSPFRQSGAATTEPVGGVLFRSSSLADAREVAKERVQPLYQLQAGWDSYDALPIDASVGTLAENILTTLASDNFPLPEVIPKSAGGVALEWHRGDRELAIELSRNGVVVVFYDPDEGEEWERSLTELGPEDLTKAFAAITREA